MFPGQTACPRLVVLSWSGMDIRRHRGVYCHVQGGASCFFYKFIKFGSTTLYERMVISPVSLDEALFHMGEYAKAGLPGCVGSINCTHIITERCKYNLKNNHSGYKSSDTTRTYNLTCNHHRQILHSTAGGPARWNNQTMVRLDQFITAIRAGVCFQDHRFELESFDEASGKVVRTIYYSVYVICDNGYLDWSCTVPPYTITSQQDEIHWSKWMESMRKDEECTFGILKGRWRNLKAGACLWGALYVDDVWLTYSTLHN